MREYNQCKESSRGGKIGREEYVKGVRKERRLVNEARASGKIAFRSAGSHGKIDVAIIDPKERKIFLIQSKAYDLSEPATKRLIKEMEFLNGSYEVIFEVR